MDREDPAVTQSGTRGPEPSAPQALIRRWGPTLTLAVVLAVFWLILSGRIGVGFFIFLALSVGIVVWLNPEHPFQGVPRAHGPGIPGLVRAAAAMVRFLAWLVWNVMKANVQVAWMILHPRLPIDPSFLVVRSGLRSQSARVLMANSITLTPGTITIDLKDDTYLVHSLSPESADALTGGELQNVVGAVFGEGAVPAPQVTWTPTFKDLGR